MPIEFACPGCHQKHDVPDTFRGKRIRCRHCRTAFTVGRPAGEVLDEVVEVVPERRPGRRSRTRLADGAPASAVPVVAIVCGAVALLFVILLVGGVAAWQWFGAAESKSLLQQVANEGAPGEPAGPSAIGDGVIPLTLLEQIKAATVFIHVEGNGGGKTGSGFVVRVDQETGFVVTNHHVITPPTRAMVPRLRGIPFPPRPGGLAQITAVFGSGTPAERSVPAQVVRFDADKDLAVLRVDGIKNLPRPIDISRPPRAVETMPVYVFGFPFGEALALHHGNPAVTVGKGSVSSIRLDDRGTVARVQIDGDLNPGNSGGPVVDTQGRLVGIAVETVPGTRIGMAIPTAELVRLLDGV